MGRFAETFELIVFKFIQEQQQSKGILTFLVPIAAAMLNALHSQLYNLIIPTEYTNPVG